MAWKTKNTRAAARQPVEQATAAPGEMRDLPPLERVQVVEIRPGDTVIATIPQGVGPEQAQQLVGELEARFPNNLVLLVQGTELSVIRGE